MTKPKKKILLIQCSSGEIYSFDSDNIDGLLFCSVEFDNGSVTKLKPKTITFDQLFETLT